LKYNKKAPIPITYKIGISLIVFGSVSLILSYILTSQVLAFTGLGFSFWGALFLAVTSKRYVESSLLTYNLLPSYYSADRIIRSLNCKGKGIYVPSYPSDVYLPDHLRGLKETVVFIPNEEALVTTPAIDELVKGKFIVDNPKGILLTPPGFTLLTKIEEKTETDFTKTTIDDLCENMSKKILDNFGLAKEITLVLKNDEVVIRIKDSIYKDLYMQGTKSVNLLGCPMVSAVACALAKSSGKPVAVSEIKYIPDELIIQAIYKVKVSE
jgi:hypothetical protein